MTRLPSDASRSDHNGPDLPSTPEISPPGPESDVTSCHAASCRWTLPFRPDCHHRQVLMAQGADDSQPEDKGPQQGLCCAHSPNSHESCAKSLRCQGDRAWGSRPSSPPGRPPLSAEGGPGVWIPWACPDLTLPPPGAPARPFILQELLSVEDGLL